MAILDIIKEGNETLRKKAKPVKKIDEKLKSFCHDMLDTMYCYKGIGLAAVQVSVLKSIIVVDITPEKQKPMVIISPVIKKAQGKAVEIEGCLSVPGREGKVERALKISVEGIGLDGKKSKITAEGLLARVIQHEVDHLNGILFIDKVIEDISDITESSLL